MREPTSFSMSFAIGQWHQQLTLPGQKPVRQQNWSCKWQLIFFPFCNIKHQSITFSWKIEIALCLFLFFQTLFLFAKKSCLFIATPWFACNWLHMECPHAGLTGLWLIHKRHASQRIGLVAAGPTLHKQWRRSLRIVSKTTQEQAPMWNNDCMFHPLNNA